MSFFGWGAKKSTPKKPSKTDLAALGLDPSLFEDPQIDEDGEYMEQEGQLPGIDDGSMHLSHTTLQSTERFTLKSSLIIRLIILRTFSLKL